MTCGGVSFLVQPINDVRQRIKMAMVCFMSTPLLSDVVYTLIKDGKIGV